MDVDDDDEDGAEGPAKGPPKESNVGATSPPPRSFAHLHGHTAPVYALDFTHDQRLLLSASGDGTVGRLQNETDPILRHSFQRSIFLLN